jgi:hypothetical protein
VKFRCLLLLSLLLPLSPSRAAAAADLSKLLEYEADVVVLSAAAEGQGGAQSASLLRLVLPADVVAKARGDLSDVRIFDRRGNEVPFVVDSGLRAGEVREASEWRAADVLDVRRDELEHEDEPSLFREQYEIAAPPPPALGSRWELVFDSARPRFVRALEVATVNQGEASPLVRDATLFRLPATATERTSLVLPPFQAERLRVTLEGADGGFLEPRFRWRSTTVFDDGERAVLPLEILARWKDKGRSIVEVARPDGVVPDVLRIETSTPAYYRAVDVFDVRQGGAAEKLGGGTVFRVQLRQPVDESEVKLSPAAGGRLRLEIVDEDSPELQDLRISAVVRRPVLFFDLPVAGEAVVGVLRFGGGRVERARYDLEQLSPAESAHRGQVARLGAMLLDRTQTRPAEVRAVRPNPSFDPAPLLAYAMQPGAAVDAASYARRRSVRVTPSADGLARLRLQPEDLAVARSDLGDVRVVAGDGRQWPYLLQRGAGVAAVDLDFAGPLRRRETSRYELLLPFAPLPIDAVEVKVDRAFYSRPFRLLARQDGDERVAAQGKLSPTRQAGPVVIGLDGRRVEGLALVIEDGDEAPIPLVAASARVRVPDVYVVAPPGDYLLLIGDPDASAPRYDLDDARAAVLAVSSVDAAVGALEHNPTYGWRQQLFGGRSALLQRAAVWSVLAAAVLALALVTVHLVRKEATRAE